MTITNKVTLKSLNAGLTPISDVPDTPTIGTATDGGTGSTASVTFTPAVTGGTPTSYTVTSSPGGFTGTGASSPITVSGLSSGTSYTFTVTATNSTGTSGSSSASNSLSIIAPGLFESIATITTTGGESSVTFSSIPQTYKTLQLRATARMNSGGGTGFTNIYLRPNNNTSTVYANNYLFGSNGTTLQTAGNGFVDNYLVIWSAGAGSGMPSYVFGSGTIDIHEYTSTSKLKTFSVYSGGNAGNGQSLVCLSSNLMNSTSAITSLVVLDLNGYDFGAGCTFNLYGIK